MKNVRFDSSKAAAFLPEQALTSMEAAVTAAASGVDGAGKEAIEALVALGYSPTEATKAVRQVTITEDMNSEAVLKASLKFLAF